MVANALMLKEASNIFIPQFIPRKSSHIVQQTIDSWCDANKIEETSITDAKNLAIELEVGRVKALENILFFSLPRNRCAEITDETLQPRTYSQ